MSTYVHGKISDNYTDFFLFFRIGEKMLAWTDGDVPLEKILEGVTLYWMTDTMPRCMYHNRAVSIRSQSPTSNGRNLLTG